MELTFVQVNIRLFKGNEKMERIKEEEEVEEEKKEEEENRVLYRG